MGWDLSDWRGNAATRIPLASYLLHRLNLALDGKPTLIVLDEGFTLLDTPLFSARAVQWFDYLTSQNAGCLITTGAIEQSGALPFTQALAQKAATLFAYRDTDPSAEYAMGFGLTAEEVGTLGYLPAGSHQVLQKRGSETLVMKMDFSGFSDPIKHTLSGRVPKAGPQKTAAEQLAGLMGFGGGAA